MLTFDSKKIAIFSDIHFGKSKDSTIKINSTIDYIDKFIQECISHKIDLIVFLGDWFDNRSSIALSTLNTAYNNLKKISNVFPTLLIVGNHDTHYKRTIEINSIQQFTEIKNVIVIDKMTEALIQDKKVLLCPWNSPVKQVVEKYDYVFGHFEYNGAALVGEVFNECDVSMNDLTNISPLVFSGHFHIRKEYPQTNGKIISVGSPLELDWGDINNSKGFYILNIDSRQYEFIENKISPIHIKYYWSKLKNQNQKLLKTEIEHNYIRLVVDDAYNFEQVFKIVNAINLCKPLKPCESDFIYNINNELLMKNINISTEIKMSKLDYIKKYINKMPDNLLEGIDKPTLTSIAEKYYIQAESNYESQ